MVTIDTEFILFRFLYYFKVVLNILLYSLTVMKKSKDDPSKAYRANRSYRVNITLHTIFLCGISQSTEKISHNFYVLTAPSSHESKKKEKNSWKQFYGNIFFIIL